MLPEVVLEQRDGQTLKTYRGQVRWKNSNGEEKSQPITVWPPTNARPNECRISQINRFDFSGLAERDHAGGQSIFMFFQQRNGILRIYFTTETSLKSENWHSTIKTFIEYWKREGWTNRGMRSAFLDLDTNEHYPK